MNIAKIVLRNVAASWCGLATQLIVTLLLTPFVIHQLGTEAYGVWLLLQGVVGYYGLLDMGLRAGLTQAITRRIADRDTDAVKDHLGAAIPLLVIIALLILLAASIVGWLLPHFVEITPEVADAVFSVVIIQAVGAAIQVTLQPFAAVLVGLQRYDIANVITVTTRLAYGFLTWGILGAGYGLVGLSAVLMATNCLDSSLRVAMAKRLLPEIRGTKFRWSRKEISEIANLGIWNFLIGVGRQVIYFSDVIMVGFLFSAKAVAPFGIAASLVDYANRLIITSTRVLFPTMAHLSRQGSVAAQRELYITATRLTVGLSVAAIIVGYTWIDSFLRLWLGTGPETESLRRQAPEVFLLLGIAFAFVGVQRVGLQLLLAEGRQRLLGILMSGEAIANVAVSIALAHYLGLAGVALGTMLPAALFGFVFHIPAHGKTLNVSSTYLMIRVINRPLLYGAVLALVMCSIHLLLPVVNSWFLLATIGILSAGVAIGILPILLSVPQLRVVVEKFKCVSKMLPYKKKHTATGSTFDQIA